MANRVKGIVVEIGGDTTSLSKAISSVSAEARDTQNELKKIEKLLKMDPTNITLLKQKQELLNQSIEKTEDVVKALKDAKDKADADMANGTEVNEKAYRELERQIEANEATLKKNRDEIKKVADAIKGIDHKKIQEMGDAFEKAGEKIEKVGDKIADAGEKALKVTGVITAAGTAAVTAADDLQTAANKYLSATGTAAHGIETLSDGTEIAVDNTEKFKEVIESIYKNNYGENFEDIADAMAAVKANISDIDASGIQSVTESALALRDTFDFEVNESVRAAEMLMDQFGITSEEAFNLIVQGAQNGLDKNGDLLDTINEYSVHFRQLGLDAPEMFNMLANGADEGTFSVDKLGDAIKEFNIRVKDTGTTTQEGFALLGYVSEDNSEAVEKLTEKIADLEKNLQYAEIAQSEFTYKTSELTRLKNADKIAEYTEELEKARAELENIQQTSSNSGESLEDLQQRFAAGGETAQDAMNEVLTALFSIEDPIQQNAAGVALFGTMWEDLGANGIKALSNLNGQISVTNDAMGTLKEQSYDDLKNQFSELGRTVVTDVAVPLGELMIPKISEIIDKISEWIAKFSELSPEAQTMIITIAGIVAGIGPLLIIVGKVTTGFGTVTSSIGTVIETLPKMQSAFSSVLGFIASNPIVAITTAVIAFVALVATKGDEMQSILQKADNFMQDVFARDWTETFGPVLGGVMNAFMDALENWWNSGMELFNGIIDFIRGVFTGDWERAWNGVEQIFSGILNTILANIGLDMDQAKSIFNSAIEFIKGLVKFEWSLPHLKMPHFSITGSFSLNPPSVPKLSVSWYAKGGILDGAQIFGTLGNTLLGGGEAGREAVLPLASFYKELRYILEDILSSWPGMDALSILVDNPAARLLTGSNVNNSTTNLGGVNIAVYGAPGQDVRELAEIVMDEIQHICDRKEEAFAT